jgi:hypothetical protein
MRAPRCTDAVAVRATRRAGGGDSRRFAEGHTARAPHQEYLSVTCSRTKVWFAVLRNRDCARERRRAVLRRHDHVHPDPAARRRTPPVRQPRSTWAQPSIRRCALLRLRKIATTVRASQGRRNCHAEIAEVQSRYCSPPLGDVCVRLSAILALSRSASRGANTFHDGVRCARGKLQCNDAVAGSRSRK